MTWREALENMLIGHKITRCDWDNSYFILNEKGVLIDENNQTVDVETWIEASEHEDWEIYRNLELLKKEIRN